MNDILLVKSGFPVNFDGNRENIDPELIQLTIALIAAGVLQARNMPNKNQVGIISLDEQMEDRIRLEFLEITK